MDRAEFWNQPDVVDRFAEREVDHRLVEVAPALALKRGGEAATRVLDLGCAAGRNAVWLAERGYDVVAVDGAQAMVDRTRERLEPLLGPEKAAQRARPASMDDLSAFDDASFDLIVALGIFHNATSGAEWLRSTAEAVRVLAPGGRLLIAHFAPGTDLTGEGVEPVVGEPNLFRGFRSGFAVLLDSAALDRAFYSLGLVPTSASDTVHVETETGQRVVVNALYGKPGTASS